MAVRTEEEEQLMKSIEKLEPNTMICVEGSKIATRTIRWLVLQWYRRAVIKVRLRTVTFRDKIYIIRVE